MDIEDLRKRDNFKDYVKILRELQELQNRYSMSIAAFQEMVALIVVGTHLERKHSYTKIFFGLTTIAFLSTFIGLNLPEPTRGFLLNIGASMYGSIITFAIFELYWKRIDNQTSNYATTTKKLLFLLQKAQQSNELLDEIREKMLQGDFRELPDKLKRFKENASNIQNLIDEFSQLLDLQKRAKDRTLFKPPA